MSHAVISKYTRLISVFFYGLRLGNHKAGDNMSLDFFFET